MFKKANQCTLLYCVMYRRMGPNVLSMNSQAQALPLILLRLPLMCLMSVCLAVSLASQHALTCSFIHQWPLAPWVPPSPPPPPASWSLFGRPSLFYPLSSLLVLSVSISLAIHLLLSTVFSPCFEAFLACVCLMRKGGGRLSSFALTSLVLLDCQQDHLSWLQTKCKSELVFSPERGFLILSTGVPLCLRSRGTFMFLENVCILVIFILCDWIFFILCDWIF